MRLPPTIWNYPDDPLTLPRADFDAAYPDRDDPPIDASRHFRTIVSHLCGCRHPICAAARSVEVERASFFFGLRTIVMHARADLCTDARRACAVEAARGFLLHQG